MYGELAWKWLDIERDEAGLWRYRIGLMVFISNYLLSHFKPQKQIW
jgi:hypothetical protein